MRTTPQLRLPTLALFSDLDAPALPTASLNVCKPVRADDRRAFSGTPFGEVAEFVSLLADDTPGAVLERFVDGVDRRNPGAAFHDGRDLKLRDATTGRDAPESRPARLVKAIFDYYFREDLYGHWIDREPIVLSSGSVDETMLGLPSSLKACVTFALSQNWYGYSDSLGRRATCEALARLESSRFGSGDPIAGDQIMVTLGGTAAISSIARFVAREQQTGGRSALCCTPNYAPLVAAIADVFPVSVAPLALRDEGIDVAAVIDALQRQRPALVLVQTVVNPWGQRLTEAQVAAIIEAAPPDCMVVLDECHDVWGAEPLSSPLRLRENVVAVRSISKDWGAPGLKLGWVVGHRAFMERFYHHASNEVGGPASVFALLLEMYAIFEHARRTGGLEPEAVLPLVSADYALSAASLRRAYDDYVVSRAEAARFVNGSKAEAASGLQTLGFDVLLAPYSINLVARFSDLPSYDLYRRLVSEAGVSVFPTLLTFSGAPGVVRISPCVPTATLGCAIDRLGAWVERSGGLQ